MSFLGDGQYGPVEDDRGSTSHGLEDYRGSSVEEGSSCDPPKSSATSYHSGQNEVNPPSRRSVSRSTSKSSSVHLPPTHQPAPNPYDPKEIERRHKCRKKLFSLLKAERKYEDELDSMIQVRKSSSW